jgi:hypothetical protein
LPEFQRQPPQAAPATLAVGAGAGTALGAVMYAVAPLGLSKDATEPWLAGSAIDPVVALAWILLLGAPVAAGVMAVRRYRGPGSPQELAGARLRQGIVAGLLATGVGALIVTVLGTATIALMPRAAWLRHWLFPGRSADRPDTQAGRRRAWGFNGHRATGPSRR